MTVVRNTVLGADGNPAQLALVTVVLADSLGGQHTGYLSSSTVVATATTHSDEDGFWQLDMVPNADITPDNTYYLIIEQAGSGLQSRHLVEVPSSGPVDLTNILVAAPGPLGAIVIGGVSGGAPVYNVVTKTANATLTYDESLVKADATSGAITLTLPTAVGHEGEGFIIKRMNDGSNSVIADGNASETIDGISTYALAVQYETVSLVSDNANWIVA